MSTEILPSPTRDRKGRLQPGSVLNPTGNLPGGKLFTPALKRRLQEIDPIDPLKRTHLEVIVQVAIEEAKVDIDARRDLLNRVDGKPTEYHEVNQETNVTLTRVTVNLVGVASTSTQTLLSSPDVQCPDVAAPPELASDSIT